MFRNNQQDNQQDNQQEDLIKQKMSLIDLKNVENQDGSLEAIKVVLEMIEDKHLSPQFITAMYYETKYKVDDHHEKISKGGYRHLSVETFRSISIINVKFAEIHFKFQELWEESKNNLVYRG